MAKILNLSKLASEVEKSRFTKIQLAERCGISRVTLDAVLKGKEIGLMKFLKLVDTLGVSVGFLFDEDITIDNRTAGHDYSEHGGVHYHLGAQSSTASGEGSGSADSAVLAERVKALEAMVAEKERLIQVLLERK